MSQAASSLGARKELRGAVQNQGLFIGRREQEQRSYPGKMWIGYYKVTFL